MQIVQTQIYLRPAKPKIALAGDGSLILLNRTVTEELKVVDDRRSWRQSERMLGDDPDGTVATKQWEAPSTGRCRPAKC